MLWRIVAAPAGSPGFMTFSECTLPAGSPGWVTSRPKWIALGLSFRELKDCIVITGAAVLGPRARNCGILLLPDNSGAANSVVSLSISPSGSIRMFDSQSNLREIAIQSCDRVLAKLPKFLRREERFCIGFERRTGA
jgi:hypothetical protein